MKYGTQQSRLDRRVEKLRTTVALAAALACAAPAHADAQVRMASAGTGISVNRTELQPDVVQALADTGIRVAPGDYWYDPVSGLYGLLGGPGVGFTMPGLELGGPLPADASGGDTHVFVNGRELHPADVAALNALLGTVYPGRYWLRWDGWYGWEGGPPVGNLLYVVQQSSRAGGRGYNRTNPFGHLGSDGQTSYFFDPGTGCSVISGGGVSC